jgi:hypothetical protein
VKWRISLFSNRYDRGKGVPIKINRFFSFKCLIYDFLQKYYNSVWVTATTFFGFGSGQNLWILSDSDPAKTRDAPDTVFAGYPANPKAGYRISGRIPDIRPDTWLDNYLYFWSNKFIKTALTIISFCKH